MNKYSSQYCELTQKTRFMPNTKKNHGHEHDTTKKGMGSMENEKMKGGKPANEKGRSEGRKGGENMNTPREGNR